MEISDKSFLISGLSKIPLSFNVIISERKSWISHFENSKTLSEVVFPTSEDSPTAIARMRMLILIMNPIITIH